MGLRFGGIKLNAPSFVVRTDLIHKIMKKLFFVTILAMIGFLPFGASAQINVNIGMQPLWGPVGYDHVDYYYLPDVESYYDVPNKQFVYLNDNKWVFANALPSKYANYNLYNGYKVVLNSPKPYLGFKTDKVKYAKFKGIKTQKAIVRSDNPKYYVVKGHPGKGKSVSTAKKGNGKMKVQVKGNNGNGKGKGGKGKK
jgi:hypothetical protein